MSQQKLFDYVMNTPHNTNPAILKQMIDEAGGTGSGDGGTVNSVNNILPDEHGNVEIGWNDLNDKPFGEETADILVCEAEDLDFSDAFSRSYSIKANGGALVLGQEYTVLINGQEYTCVAKEDTENGCISCGNTTLWADEDFSPSGEDTGEPFVFANRRSSNKVIEFCFAETLPEVISFSVRTVGPVLTPIPDEFLPESVFKNGDTRFCLESPDGNRFWFMVNNDGELVPWEK